MVRAVSDSLLQEYATHRSALQSLAARLHARVEALLDEASVPVSFVSWRLKDEKSLAHKLARPDKSYRTLWDVTDLIGLRVSVSFEDHIDVVSRLIEKHFQVDFGHSIERVRPAGYRSLHYVCAHADAPHPAFRFEVQVRTALQHAWAEMEHDLGYKVNDAVPEPIRHRFARVAGLLEIADQEFVSIRRELVASREAARRTLAKSDGDLPLDLVSLEALVRQPALEALDASVARALGVPLERSVFFPGYLVDLLSLCGLTTTQAVLQAVEHHAAEVSSVLPRYLEFAKRELDFDATSLTAIEGGYGLLFVAHLHVVRGAELGLSKVARLTRLYQQLEFPDDERRAHRVASGLVSALT
jgi:ppGpp synthetase/RelA/SpoT-type nucleotidyltranferase